MIFWKILRDTETIPDTAGKGFDWATFQTQKLKSIFASYRTL